MLSGLLAPCMRHVRQPYAAGFLQRSRLRFDMAVHWAALCFVTLGNGMLNSAEYVDRGEEGEGRYIARLPSENKALRLLPGWPCVVDCTPKNPLWVQTLAQAVLGICKHNSPSNFFSNLIVCWIIMTGFQLKSVLDYCHGSLYERSKLT